MARDCAVHRAHTSTSKYVVTGGELHALSLTEHILTLNLALCRKLSLPLHDPPEPGCRYEVLREALNRLLYCAPRNLRL